MSSAMAGREVPVSPGPALIYPRETRPGPGPNGSDPVKVQRKGTGQKGQFRKNKRCTIEK